MWHGDALLHRLDGVGGRLEVAPELGSSTLDLSMAAPGSLMFGPQVSLVTAPFKPRVVFAGLDLLLVDDLVHEIATAAAWA